MRMLFTAAALLALAFSPAPAATGAAAPAEVRLYVLDCGRIELADADDYADDGAYKGLPKTLANPCFLIRHPGGDLLWDTGVPQALADTPPADRPEGVVVERRLTDQLAELGLAPEDIEFVSLSHSHFDHIGNAVLFTKATWIVDADEHAHAFRPRARAHAESFQRYAALEQRPTLLIEGDGPHDVFGDGTAVIHPAPGHTPGHSVLLVKLERSGPVLLSGDMWHVAESQAARRVPRFNADRAATLRSMERVEALAKETGARLVRQHVPADIAALPAFPEPMG